MVGRSGALVGQTLPIAAVSAWPAGSPAPAEESTSSSGWLRRSAVDTSTATSGSRQFLSASAAAALSCASAGVETKSKQMKGIDHFVKHIFTPMESTPLMVRMIKSLRLLFARLGGAIVFCTVLKPLHHFAPVSELNAFFFQQLFCLGIGE